MTSHFVTFSDDDIQKAITTLMTTIRMVSTWIETTRKNHHELQEDIVHGRVPTHLLHEAHKTLHAFEARIDMYRAWNKEDYGRYDEALDELDRRSCEMSPYIPRTLAFDYDDTESDDTFEDFTIEDVDPWAPRKAASAA